MALPITDPTIRALQARRAYYAEQVAVADMLIAGIERTLEDWPPQMGCAPRCAFQTHPNEN